MRVRSLLLAVLVAASAPGAGTATTTTGRTVEARFRPGVHRVELTVDIAGGSMTLSQNTPGAIVYKGTAEIFWRRTDRRGNPWFESAEGSVTALVDEANGTMRLRGALREHFHKRKTKIDITFRRTDAAPFADLYPPGDDPPGDDVVRASGTAGLRWTGMATGVISGSLGRLTGLKARAYSSQAASGTVSL